MEKKKVQIKLQKNQMDIISELLYHQSDQDFQKWRELWMLKEKHPAETQTWRLSINKMALGYF